MPRPPRRPANKMLCGAVGGHRNNYGSYLWSTNLVNQMGDGSVRYLQTTLAEPHVQGSGIFRFANPKFPEGDRRFPNAHAGTFPVKIRNPSTGDLVQLDVYKTNGSTYARVANGPGFTGDRDWPQGTVVDFGVIYGDWQNPGGLAVAEFVTPDGRKTTCPAGLAAGQSIRMRISPAAIADTQIVYPQGNYAVLANGTGTLRFQVTYRDRPDLDSGVQVVNVVGGVASGPLVFATAEANSLDMVLAASDPSDPLHDIRVIVPGTWPDDGSPYAGQTFLAIHQANAADPSFYLPHPDYIAVRKQFRHFRAVDDVKTIQPLGDMLAGPVDVFDLTPPTHRLGMGADMPIDHVIRECVLAENDLWLNHSKDASDAVIAHWRDRWKTLAAGTALKLMPAGECEPWNFQFSSYSAFMLRGCQRYNPRSAAVLGDSKTFAVTSVVWKWDANSSYLEVTTAVSHGFTSNTVVRLANAANPAINGVWRCSVDAGITTPTTFRLHYLNQSTYKAPLADSPTPVTFAAASGQQMFVAVLGEDSPTPGVTIQSGNVVADYQGYWSARVHQVIQAGFAGNLAGLSLIVEGFVAGVDYNRRMMARYIAECGGTLLPVSDVAMVVATYVDPTTYDQRADYVGDLRPLASAVVSNGVATLTCDSWQPDLVNAYNTYVTDFNFFDGDYLYLSNANVANTYPAVKVSGKFGPVTVTGSSTCTVPMPGVPDGPLSPVRGPIYVIRGTPKGTEIIDFARNGTSLTLTSPGHPWVTGSTVRIGGLAPVFAGEFTITGTTANTVTVVVPGASYDPQFSFTGRAYLYSPSTVTIAAPARLARLSEPSYLQWLEDCVTVAREFGVDPGLYETGYQDAAASYCGYVGWIESIFTANESDPAMADLTLGNYAAHAAAGFWLHTYYCLMGWVHYGLKPSPEASRPAWDAAMEAVAQYGVARSAPGPATKVVIDPPPSAMVGVASGWADVGFDGIPGQAYTVTLSDGEAGGTFSPSDTFSFVGGAASPQGYRYTAASPGKHAITATASPPLGNPAETTATTIDADGNPGNATVLFSDGFNRADGPAGSNWTSLPVDKALIAGNALTLGGSFPRAVAFPAMTPTLHQQVKARLVPDPGGVAVTWAFSLRVDPATRIGYYVTITGGDNLVRFYRRFPEGDGYYGSAELSAPVPIDRVMDVTFKITGTPGRIVGWLDDPQSGVRLGSWDFPIPGHAFGDESAVIPPITAPGVVGFSGDLPSPRFDDVVVSRLDFATAISLTGPSSVAQGSTVTLLISTVGGPILQPTTVTLSDGQGGTFDPATVAVDPADYNPIPVAYTPSGSAGQRTVTATASPALGNPATLAVTVGSGVIVRYVMIRRAV